MQPLRLRLNIALVCGALATPFVACNLTTQDGSGSESRASAQSPLGTLPDQFERVLAWGNGEGQLALRGAVPESVAYGPNAVALLPSGETLILDRLAGRVVSVTHEGAPRTLATVPVHAEDLVSGADGNFVAFSPLAARAWFFDASGKPSGEMAVPRVLRDLQSLSLGGSRRLSVRTGYQETFALGSPSAPLPLPVVLHTRSEGALALPDGRGVAARVDDGIGKILVLSQPADENARSEVLASHTLPGAATAVRLIGGTGTLACMRIEQVTDGAKLGVTRRALCLDVQSGEVLLDQNLGAPGLYVPRTELAFGGGRLAFIRPTAEGLVLTNRVVAAHGEVAQ